MDLFELLDSEHKEMKAKAFNDKINYIKKNGFLKVSFHLDQMKMSCLRMFTTKEKHKHIASIIF